jgi:hypothetical protein
MSLWRQISRGVRVLVDRNAADRDIADEVDSYVEQATAAWLERGLGPAEARRAARLEVGNLTALREEVREYGWENSVASLFADLRYAVRRLAGNRSFATASVLTLALGIGAANAIFSAVDGVLLKPLPYPHAGRLTLDFGVVVCQSLCSACSSIVRTGCSRSPRCICWLSRGLASCFGPNVEPPRPW